MTQETETTTDGNDKGLPPGVPASVTDGGNRGDGAPQAPVVNNAPPVKEQTPEEKATAAAKVAEAEAAQLQTDKDAQAALDAKKAEEEAADEAATEYVDYGDANANAVVDMLKEAKIPVAEAHALFKEAIETGDFSKIDVSKLTEKLGQAKATLVLNGVQTYYNTVTANTKKTVEAVYQEVGGEANYKKVQTWARQQAAKDPAFKAKMEGLNQMFDLNQTAAVMAARDLVAAYEKADGNSSLSRKQVHGERSFTNSESTGEYLSRADYLAKVKEAHAKGDMHAVASLRAQRAASHKQQ